MGATKMLARTTLAGLLALSLALAACSGGSTGAQGPQGPPGPPGSGTDPEAEYKPLPGVHIVITSLTGANGPGGVFLPGNTPTVHFTLKNAAGEDLDLANMTTGEIYLSGPSFNYQRVLFGSPDNFDPRTATFEGSGTWAYTFPSPIPATYLPPFNDSPSFGTADGELTGQALLDGTYTVGMALTTKVTVGATVYDDAGAATFDFLLGGGATSIDHRAVVQNDNCNVCHTELRVHDGLRKDVNLCVLCHTAGAEDSNVAGATPGVTIEFKVMVHKIHNGSHLPSVLGVSTDASGARLYPGYVGSVPPRPLQFADDEGGVADFSDVVYPVWPNLNIAMPKDLGYSALSSTDPDGSGPLLSPKTCDDTIRFGVTACAKCHGDPDAAGPLTAPAQGGLCYTQPTEQACGSCHDDIDWTKPYTSNGATMPIQPANGGCLICHTPPGVPPGALPTLEAHLHPLLDPAIDPGVDSAITAVTGGTGPGGNFLNGDPVKVTLTIKNDAGTDIGLATMDSCSAFFLGNTKNRQLVMPLTSANGMTLNPFDFTGRLQAPSSSGKGTMSKAFLGTPAVAETLVVEFTSGLAFTVTGTVSGALGGGALTGVGTQPSGASVSNFDLGASIASTETVAIAFSSATAFTVTGSTSGLLGSGNLPAAKSASTRFASPKLSFNIAVGTTSFATGNQFNLVLFRGAAADPVLFAVVAGTSAFSGAAPARDRFYYELVPSAPTYTINIPMDMQLEYLGNGSGVAGQVLSAGNVPVYYGRQQLWEATATATTTTTLAAVNALARQVNVSPVTGFAAGDTVVVDPAGGVGAREYVTITPAKADGKAAASGDPTARIYFRTPLRYAHGSVTITKVTLALKSEGAGNVYTLSGGAGTVTSNATPFTAGLGVVMTYRTDAHFGYRRHFTDTLQAYWVPPANDTVGIGQEQGDWQGLPYLSGTYTADVWFYKNIDLGLQNEVQTYRSASAAGTKDFLYGSATVIEPKAIISTSANCYTCHNDVIFHGGGRRGVDACLTCHSTSGSTNSILDPSYPIEFRQMLHKIHMGRNLTNAVTYPFATQGVFPAMPGEVKQCVRCHGNDAWKQPAPRVDPAATVPTRVWGVVCGSCHDSDPAHAHIDTQTPGGTETCEVCHGPGKVQDVVKVHFPR